MPELDKTPRLSLPFPINKYSYTVLG